jgi:hypothetical protein
MAFPVYTPTSPRAYGPSPSANLTPVNRSNTAAQTKAMPKTFVQAPFTNEEKVRAYKDVPNLSKPLTEQYMKLNRVVYNGRYNPSFYNIDNKKDSKGIYSQPVLNAVRDATILKEKMNNFDNILPNLLGRINDLRSNPKADSIESKAEIATLKNELAARAGAISGEVKFFLSKQKMLSAPAMISNKAHLYKYMEEPIMGRMVGF